MLVKLDRSPRSHRSMVEVLSSNHGAHKEVLEVCRMSVAPLGAHHITVIVASSLQNRANRGAEGT